IPILGELTPGTTQRHLIKLPGAALANDEPRPVISVAGAKPGPVFFVNAGVHGGEYPAVEAVIRLGKTLDPKKILGTVILMPVLNLPAFRTRKPFVCPIDNVNPNRVFTGGPRGRYAEQMPALGMNEDSKFESHIANSETNSKPKPKRTARAVATTVLTKFEWLYTKSTGVWYPKVAQGDVVNQEEQIGTVGDLFGETLENINSP